MRRFLESLTLGGKLLALVPAFIFFFSLGGLFVESSLPAGVTPEPGPFPKWLALLIVGAVHVSVVALLILWSRLSGWRLMLTTALVYYGATTFLMHIESGVFLLGLSVSPQTLLGLFLMGLPPSLGFVPLAVWVLGKGRSAPDEPQPASQSIPAAQWAWRLSAIAVTYTIVYLLAGYYIAWRDPALRAFYGGTDPGGFVGMLRQNVQEMPWVFPLQLVRGVLWALLALPIVHMTRGGAPRAALATALLFALPPNIAHLLPNPLMPANSMRMAHMLEVMSSNFVFGLLAVALLCWGRESVASRRSTVPVSVTRQLA